MEEKISRVCIFSLLLMNGLKKVGLCVAPVKQEVISISLKLFFEAPRTIEGWICSHKLQCV